MKLKLCPRELGSFLIGSLESSSLRVYYEDNQKTALVPLTALLTSLPRMLADGVLSSFLFHGLLACFSSSFIDGISWIKYFKCVFVIYVGIPGSFFLSFADQRVEHPGKYTKNTTFQLRLMFGCSFNIN